MKIFKQLGRDRRKRSPKYKGRCGNCHKFIGEDKYCRFCGTKAGEGDYEPFVDEIQCIYGPPPTRRTHKCRDCGYEWTTNMMIDNQYYCPECGSNNTSVESGGLPL